MREFCERKVEEEARAHKVYWYAMSNIATANNAELLQDMARAGCVRLMWGIETVNPESLNDEKKFKTYADTARVLSLAEQAGILNHGFLMIDFRETHLTRSGAQYIDSRASTSQYKGQYQHPFPRYRRLRHLEKRDQRPRIWPVTTAQPYLRSPVPNGRLVQGSCAGDLRRFYGSLEYQERMDALILGRPPLQVAVESWVATNKAVEPFRARRASAVRQQLHCPTGRPELTHSHS